MDLTTIDLSKGTYTVRIPRKERSFSASLDDWTFELGAFMWLEGLFDEDPALRGRSAMKHNLILTAPSGARALFEHVCLSAEGLYFDYIPHSWGASLPEWEKRIGEVYSHLVEDQGMFEDNHTAARWASSINRIADRGLPRKKTNFVEGVPAQRLHRFFQRCFLADDKGKPLSGHLRWFTKVLAEDHSADYGDLICLHDEGAKEFRLLSHSQTLLSKEAVEQFKLSVDEVRLFLEELED